MSLPNFLNVDPVYCCSSGSSEYLAVSVWIDGMGVAVSGPKWASWRLLHPCQRLGMVWASGQSHST